MSEQSDYDLAATDAVRLDRTELGTLRKARIARTAGMALTPEDWASELSRLEPTSQETIRRRVNLRRGAGTSGLIRSIRTKLVTADEHHAAHMLLDCLESAVVMMAELGDLDEQELAALLAGRLDEVDLDPETLLSDALRDPLEFGRTAPARAAVWAAVASSGRDGDVAALAWLVADPPESFSTSQRAALLEAWRHLRARNSRLPEVPATAAQIAMAVAEEQETVATAATASDTESKRQRPEKGLMHLIGDSLASDLDLDGLVERGDELEQRRQDVARGSAAELSRSVTEGRLFSEDALKDVIAFAGQLMTFFEAIADITDQPAPGTLDAARDQIARAVAARAGTARQDRARRVATLTAPAYLAEDAQKVRDVAAGVTADTPAEVLAGLEALVTLIELGDSDPVQAVELSRAVSVAIPAAVPLLMFTAQPGTLQIADSALGADEVGDTLPESKPTTTTDPDIEPRSRAKTVSEPDPEPEAGAQAEAEPDSEPEAGLQADPRPSTETDAEPKSEAESGAEPDQGPETPSVLAPAPAASIEVPTIEDALRGLTFAAPTASAAREPRDDNADFAPGDLIMENPPDSVGHTAHQVDELYSALLADRQYALAYWLSTSRDYPDSIRAAHKLAAHAAAIRTSTGPNAAAFAATVGRLDAVELHDHLGAQMLIYGAAVRAGLLSPTAGAAGPLRDVVTSVVRSGDAVNELTEVLLKGIYAGLHITPRGFNAVEGAAEADDELERLAHDAETLFKTTSSRNLVYRGATELLQKWFEPDGLLGAPLAVVVARARDAASLDGIRRHIATLRDRHQVGALIDKERRRRRIESRAREQLIGRAGDVADLLSQWITIQEHFQQPGSGTWMDDPMSDLRNQVASIRERALVELAALSGNGAPGRAAALEAGRAMLVDALDLLAGKAPAADSEILPQRVLGGPLALAARLSLNSDLTPRRPVTVDDVADAYDALHAGTAGWRAAFNARSSRNDHVGTELLIDLLRGSDPSLAEEFGAAREAALDSSTQLIDNKVAALTQRIDTDQLGGRLTSEAWADLAARARALQPAMRGTRRDNDVMLETLDKIESDREAATEEAVAAYRDSLDLNGMRPEDAARIRSRIDAGDLTTAAEYVQTLADGQALPTTHDQVNHLELFAAFPPLFTRRSPAGANPMITKLQRLLETGAQPDPGPLADALTGANIDLTLLPRREATASRLEQWTALSAARSVNSQINTVKSLLPQVGFTVDTATLAADPSGPTKQRAGRHGWLDLAGVRATVGSALLPAFGSAMSPAGHTLRLLAVWNSPSPAELVEMLRGQPADRSVIVLYFGALDGVARRQLASQFRTGRKLPPSAVIDDAVFAYLACQPNPGRDITMAITLPFTSSSPFTDVAGIVPQEMFYGRTEERDQVVDMMGPCLVYGGRQLGKTVLLVAAEREFDNGTVKRAVYLTIRQVGQTFSTDAVWTELWQALSKKDILPERVPDDDVDATLVTQVEKWIAARPGRQLLILLDESDFFLDGDAQNSFPHVDRFKTLMEATGRRVKVVFAGLHQTARFERLANHPLAHFGNPVCVGPLAPQPAHNLLVKPLAALGYRFPDDDLPARVLALTNNQPALIQLFGRQLLDNLRNGPLPAGAPPQPITIDDVERVWADAGLRELFRKKFDLTLNLDPHYKVIAYAVALNAHSDGVDSAMSPAELRNDCEAWWPTGFAAEDIRTGEFRALLDECVDLGVLSRAGRGYRLRTPNVLDLLGSREDVEEFLERAEGSLEPTEVFNAALMRPAFGEGITRGPLTSSQLADLLAVRSQVHLVTGSTALTANRCIKALQQENDRAVGDRRKAELRTATITTVAKTCAQATLKAAGRHAIVVVDLRDATAPVAADVWKRAQDLVAEHTTGTLGIILISHPAQAAMWPDAIAEADASSRITELRRYEDTDLRLALAETALSFQDAASRAAILTLTGGWPRLVNNAFEALYGDSTTDPLAPLRRRLNDPQHANEFLTETGAYADPVIAAAWKFLVDFDEPADPDTMVGLLDVAAAEADGGNLSDDALALAGYRDRGAIVTVMRSLGLLIADLHSDVSLRVEPVAAAATRLGVR